MSDPCNEPQLLPQPRSWPPAPWKWHGFDSLEMLDDTRGMQYLMDFTETTVIPGVPWFSDDASMHPAGALIALAPEMAEAILAKYAPCGTDDPEMGTAECSDRTANWPRQCDYHENAPKLYDVAAKLRAIGGAS